MSSVQSNVDCPRCKYPEATRDWSSHGYLVVCCERCGYYYENVRQDDGQFKETERKPAGAFAIYDRTGRGQLGSLADAKEQEAFEQDMLKYQKEAPGKIAEVICTFEKNDVWYAKDVLNNTVMPYDTWKMLRDTARAL